MENDRMDAAARDASNENDGTSRGTGASERGDDTGRADEEIRMRAYELYLQRGDQPGDDMDDWLRAEREIGDRSGGRSSEGGERQRPDDR